MLDIDRIMENKRQVSLTSRGIVIETVDAGVDILGRYFFQIPSEKTSYNCLTVALQLGAKLVDPALTSPRHEREITEIHVLWSMVEEQENVPTHWMVDTKAEGEDHIVRGR